MQQQQTANTLSAGRQHSGQGGEQAVVYADAAALSNSREPSQHASRQPRGLQRTTKLGKTLMVEEHAQVMLPSTENP